MQQDMGSFMGKSSGTLRPESLLTHINNRLGLESGDSWEENKWKQTNNKNELSVGSGGVVIAEVSPGAWERSGQCDKLYSTQGKTWWSGVLIEVQTDVTLTLQY